MNAYNAPFDVVYTDMWGPPPHTSNCGFWYFISFVDAHTKYTQIYFLKNKSKARHAFQLFLKFVHIQFHSIIKIVEYDNEGESRPFTKFLAELGSLIDLHVLELHIKMDLWGRKHRYITEMGLTLLSHASIPLHFWDHSFSIMVHVINLISSVGLLEFHSPYRALYHKLLNLESIKVFICAWFVFTLP